MSNMSMMDHSKMDHSKMDHSKMDHSKMNHSKMNQASGMSHMSMNMYFNFSSPFYMLLESLFIKEPLGIFGCCVVLMFATIGYEGLKAFREYLLYKSLSNKKVKSVPKPTDDSEQMLPENESPVSPCGDTTVKVVEAHPSLFKKFVCQRFNKHHILQSFLHLVQSCVSYILMLAFMTFNAWVCISILIGSMIGYFVFGWRKSQFLDNLDHCH